MKPARSLLILTTVALVLAVWPISSADGATPAKRFPKRTYISKNSSVIYAQLRHDEPLRRLGQSRGKQGIVIPECHLWIVEPLSNKRIRDLAAELNEGEFCGLMGFAASEDLAVISKMRGLEFLDLNASSLSDDDMRSLATIPTLNTLILRGSEKLSGAGLSELAKTPKLRHLHIEPGRGFTGAGLEQLAESQTLEVLYMTVSKDFVPSNIRSLAKAKRLRRLELIGFGVTNEVLAAIAELKGLEELSVGAQRMPEQLGVLKALPRLRVLSIMGARDGSLAELGQLKNIEWLQLPIYGGRGSGLKSLSELPRLRRLDISGATYGGMNDEGLQHIGALGKLQHLEITSCSQLRDGGVAHIGKLTNLESLKMQGCRKLSDDAVAHLTNLSKLRDLHLGGMNIGAGCIPNIARLKNLRKLAFERPRPIAAALPRLKELKQLKRLHLSDTMANRDYLIDIHSAKKTLPNVSVETWGDNTSTIRAQVAIPRKPYSDWSAPALRWPSTTHRLSRPQRKSSAKSRSSTVRTCTTRSATPTRW